MTAQFSLPSGHPFTNVRPGYTGYESAPSPAIISATASYIGSTITLQVYANTPGNWNVVTPAGLTVTTPPVASSSSTPIVYTGGQSSLSYTFYTISLAPAIGPTVGWLGPAPSVTLTVPPFGTTIASGVYDGNAVYLTPVTATPLTPLVQGITDYFFTCTNNASFASVDSVGVATFPYPSGTVFTPGTSTIFNFNVACRFLGILGVASSPVFPVTVIQPATPIMTVTPTSGSINISWAETTPNCTFTISTGGTTLVPTTNPFTVTRSPGTYSFQVGATLFGLTSYSTVRTISVAPSMPTSFTAADNLNNSVTLSWVSATPGAQINLTWTGAATGSSNNLGNPPFILSLGCGTYSFTLVSVCGGVTSSSTSVNNFSVTPSTPTNFQQSVFGSTATLSWSEATPGCGFTLTSSPDIGVVPVITGNVAVYTGVHAGTYTITLVSVSAGLNSVSSVQTTTAVTLAAPTSFSATSLGSKITLNWAESTAGASFSLSCTNNSAFGTQTISAGVFTTSYGNVSTPGIYTFSIVSVLPGNNMSAPITCTGQIVAPPASFTAVATGSTINLAWTEATTGCTFSLSSSPTVPNLTITGNTATSTGVTPGKYTFNLSAFTSAGSFLSTTVSSATQVIATPGSLSAVFVAPNVVLTWTEATSGCTFTLSSSPALTNPTPTTALTAQYSSPLPGNYTFFVTAADTAGNTSSTASTTIPIVVTPPAPSNLAYTATSPTSFTISFSEALANCTFGFTGGPTVGSVTVAGGNGSYSGAFSGVTPAGAQSFTITVNSSFGGILSTGNSSIVARTKPNTTFSSNALCTVIGGQNTVSAQYIINNPDGVILVGPGNVMVTTSYTVKMLYSGSTTTPGVALTSTNSAGTYFTNWFDAGGFSITVPSAFPDYIVPPTMGTVTVSGTTITVPWTDSSTPGSLTYNILNSTLSATGIATGTRVKVFTGATVGTPYSFTITTTSGYVTANSATSTAVTPISAPTGLTASAVGTTVTMNWTYGSLTGITFNVYDQSGNTRGTTGLTTTNTTFTVSDSTAYTFTVQAIAQGGNVKAMSAGGVAVTTVPAPSITSILEDGALITITCATPTSGTLSIAQSSGTTITRVSATNPFTYNGTTANTTYGFTVTNTGTNSITTTTASFTTMGTPTFTKSDASGQSVILQWTYPSGAPAATSYTVYLQGGTTVSAGITAQNYTFIPSSGTPPFVYTVAATGAPGTGFGSVPTDNITPLTAVTIGNPGATSADGTNVTVTWTYPTTSTAGVTFKVYDPTLATLYTTYSYSSVNSAYSTTFSTSLTRNSTYSFVVMTTDAQGDTAVSAPTANVTLLTAPIAKSIIQTGGQIVVTLSAQPAITPAPYTPYYTNTSIFPASLTLTASTATSFTYSGALSDTTCSFTFQNNAGAGAPNSTNSSIIGFQTLPTPVPVSITYISSSTSISASWTYNQAVAGTQFILKNSADGSQFGTVTGVTNANISAIIGTTYTLTVTASSGGNVSLPSTAFSAVTAALPFTISSFVQNGTQLITTISGSAISASTVPPLGFPTVFPGSPTLWLDAADPNATGIPAANGATISVWKDKSGLGSNATATGTPTINSTGINGKPTMTFDGSSWFTGLTTNTGTTATVFIVMQQPAPTSSINPDFTRVFSMAALGGYDSDVTGLLVEFVGGYVYGYRGNLLSAFQEPINTAYIMDFELDGTNAISYFNGTAQPGFGSTANFNIGRYRVGGIAHYDGPPQYTGYVSEVILFKEALTADQRKGMEYYLAQKWSIAGVPSGFTGSPLTFTFKGASANTNYIVNVVGTGLTVSSTLTTLFTPAAPTLAAVGTGVFTSSTYNGSTTLPGGITMNYFNASGNSLLASSPTNSFVATASQSYTLYARATNGLNTSISSANSVAITPIGPITYTRVSTTGGGVAFTCFATGSTSFSGSSPGLSSTVNGNVITFSSPSTPGVYYVITIVATNATGATSSISITEKTSFAPAAVPGMAMWYDAADITTIGFRVTTPTVANLQFWLDASDSTNLSAPGGNLTQINDKSGNNYTAMAASTVDYSSATNLIHFHNNQYLNLPQSSINNAAIWSMFMVIQPVNIVNTYIMSKQRAGQNANSPTTFGIGVHSGPEGFAKQITPGTLTYKTTNGGTGGSPEYTATAILTTSLQVLSMVYDGTNLKTYLNGTLSNTSPGNWPIINQTDGNMCSLGAWATDSGLIGAADFYLGELQFYNTNLGDADRQKVEGYLAWKWALQASLPTTHTYSTTKVTVGPTFTNTYSSTQVSTWRDKSGNGLDLAYPGGSYPTYSPTLLGGQYPGINFNGNSYLATTNFLPVPILSSNGTDTTIFIVYNDPNTDYTGTFTLDTDIQYAINTWGTNKHYFQFGGSYVFNNINFTVTPGPQLYTIEKQGSNSTWYNFGGIVTNGTSSTAATLTSISQRFNVGTGYPLTTTYYKSFISEIIIYNYALNSVQRQQMEGYLAWKWGLQNALSTNNPYTKAPPPSYIGPLSSGPIEWIDGSDSTSMNFVYSPTAQLVASDIAALQAWYDASDATTIVGGSVTVPSPQVWYDGKDPNGNGSIPSDGTSVTTWANKAPTGATYNAVQATGYSAATYSTTCNALNFTNTTTAYSTGYAANPTAETMFVVANNSSPGSNNNMVIGGQSGARSLGWGYNPLGSISYLNNELKWLASAPGGYTSATTALVTGQVNGTNVFISQNGGLTSGTSTTGAGFTAGTTTYLGTDTGNKGTYYFIGYEMEVLFYNSVLTISQYQQVEGYLAWKWGLQANLPPTHPYKSAGPSWTPAGGGSIQKWNDKSGNAYNLSLGSGSGTVSYITTALGKSVNLSGGYLFINKAVNLQNYALFTVLGSPTAVYNQSVITGRPNTTASYNSTDGFGLYADATGTPDLRLYGVSGTGGSNVNTVSGALPSVALSPVLASYTSVSTGIINSWINGSAGTVITTGQTRTNTGQGFAIGAEWSGTAYANITAVTNMYEVVVMTTIPTTLQRQQMEGYLAWKWGLQPGLPTSHPYKTFAPTFANLPTNPVNGLIDKSGLGNSFSLVTGSSPLPQYSSTVKGVFLGQAASFVNTTVSVPVGYTMMAVASLTSTPGSYGRLINVGLVDNVGFMGTYNGTTNFATFTGSSASTTLSGFTTTYTISGPNSVVTIYAAGGGGATGLSKNGFGNIYPGCPGGRGGSAVCTITNIPAGTVITATSVGAVGITSGNPGGNYTQIAAGYTLINVGPSFKLACAGGGGGGGSGDGNNASAREGIGGLSAGIGDTAGTGGAALGGYGGNAGYAVQNSAGFSYTLNAWNQSSYGISDVAGYIIISVQLGGGWNDITSNSPATPVSTNPAAPSLLEMTVDGSVLTPYFNASAMTVKTGTTIAMTGMIIGSSPNNGGQFWPGYLNELLVVSRTLTSLQRAQLEGYLAWKWGLQGNLPSTHPFALGPP